MGRLLDNVFKNASKKTKMEVPSLPVNLSFTEFDHMTKRGYLAKKIGQYMGLNSLEGDLLFYLSIANPTFQMVDKDNQNEYILFLSEQLLKWNDEEQDIPQKIDELHLKGNLQNAILKAYEIHKKDIFLQEQHETAPEASNDNYNAEWQVYRDVIFAATQGQFLLISEPEVERYKSGAVFCEEYIRERSDIPICRNIAKESLEEMGFNKSKVMSWLLVLSEAITNIIKHAENGKMTLVESDDKSEIRFVIEDNGPGFPLKELPKNTLLAGYSTKKSLGQGFTLMMKMAKQVVLFTNSKGSTIILIFDSSK